MKFPKIQWAKNVFKTLLLANIYRQIPEDDIINRNRFNLFRIFSIAAIVALMAMAYQAVVMVPNAKAYPYVLTALSSILAINYLSLLKHKNQNAVFLISILSCFAALHFITYSAGGVRNSGMFYIGALILVTFMLLGSKAGKWFTALSAVHIVYFYFINENTDLVSTAFIGDTATYINQDYLVTGVISMLLIASLCNNLESKKNVVIHNITESRNKLQFANKELRKLSIVASKTDNSVVITDSYGTSEWVNDGFARMTGYTFEEAVNRNLFGLLEGPLTDKETLQDVLGKLQKKQNCSVELQLHTKNGDASWIFSNITPIVDEQGMVSKFILIMSDINERKAIENKMEQNMRNLERTNKELDKFAYVVSHDLKAPLRAIGNLTDWIEEEAGTTFSEDIRKNFNIIKGRVVRMEGLINGILDYSKATKSIGKEELLEVKDLINDTVDLLAVPENCKIDFTTDLPKIFADRIKLQQVFLNLISNSIKHNNKPSIEIKVNAFEMDKFWKFSVTDNGPGIDQKYYEKIFVIFQTLQARDEFESTGVGLAIVKKIIDEQNGKIWIESELGQGTTFNFTIPKLTPVLKEEKQMAAAKTA